MTFMAGCRCENVVEETKQIALHRRLSLTHHLKQQKSLRHKGRLLTYLFLLIKHCRNLLVFTSRI